MTVQPRRVLLASPRAFCAGVERAIEIVERTLQRHGGPVYVRKQLVHNEHVVRGLQAKGAIFVDELDEVPAEAVVVFSAHGVSPAVRAEADRRGLRTVDATCPLVTKVHLEARRFAARGDTIVFIGEAGHDEVDGAIGEAPDRTVLVETVEDVATLEPTGPVSYLTQTTLAVDETAAVVDALRARFADLRGPRGDDICYATTNRQRAVAAVADESDVVIVVGSRNSSNSNRLVDVARKRGVPAYLVDDVSQLNPEWVRHSRTIGVTAGASAPPPLVAELVEALRAYGAVEVVERPVTTETVEFSLPADVR
jgi:4-hydroxy-3-methylbut-2-enyl diphosphate reductase